MPEFHFVCALVHGILTKIANGFLLSHYNVEIQFDLNCTPSCQQKNNNNFRRKFNQQKQHDANMQ